MQSNLLNLIDIDDALFTNCSYLDLSNCDMLKAVDDQITIGHLNIHSIPGKYEDLLDLMDKLKDKNLLPDILMLCETFLNVRNHDKFHFKGYDLVNEFRKTKSKGGVSMLIRSHLRYSIREDLRIFEEGKFESIFIEISRKHKPNAVVGEIYRVPGTNETDFLENYSILLNKIRSEHKKIIIGTDQNLDFLRIKTHSNTQKFFELNLLNNLVPTIYKPTRITHSTATLIDNIYVDVELFNCARSHIVTCDISDHFLCITTIADDTFSISGDNTYVTRNINDTILHNIKGALSNTDWSFLEGLSVHEGSRVLTEKITEVMDFYAPLKTIKKHAKKCKHREPWFTVGLKKSSVKCLKMYRKVLHQPHDSAEYVNYKNYRNLYKTLRRKAKFEYYNSLILTNRQNSRKLWAILNKIVGKVNNKKDITEEMIINGVKETNADTIRDEFAKYYSEIGKSLAEKIRNKGNIVDPISHLSQHIKSSCFLSPTTPLEIEYFIKGLESKNSSGCDNISNCMLKVIYPSILHALWIIFNKSLSSGEFPNNMKVAVVKPIYKAKSKMDIANYRPISLLTVTSKILEKIVNDRLINFLQKHSVLYEGQYGFRKQRSTSDAILDLTGNILEGFNKKMYTVALFLDMTKAFDTIDHNKLFRKLEMYGFRGTTLNWLKSYLTDRNLKVIFKGILSKKYPVTFGTPQGSVLGPLLYIILANDLPKCLKFCSSIMFADDTTIFISGSNLKSLYKKMNADLKRLSQWFDYNSLSLNIEKSNYVIFKCKNKITDYHEKIEVGGKEVKRASNVKFLGVYIDEHLDWNIHIKNLLLKMTMGLYSINMTKNLLPYFSKRLLYLSNIESHLTYGISAWGPMLSSANLKKLKVQQNKAVRALLNISKRSRILPAYKKANVMTLEDLIETSLVKISYRFVNDTLPYRIVNLFELPVHMYETRNGNTLRTPHHTIQIYNKSFLGRAPHLWLQLDQSFKTKENIKSFVKNYRRYKMHCY